MSKDMYQKIHKVSTGKLSSTTFFMQFKLVVPLSNAESERIFLTLMLFVFQRETIVKSLESLLHVHSDNNFSLQGYTEVTNMFITEFPDGT